MKVSMDRQQFMALFEAILNKFQSKFQEYEYEIQVLNDMVNISIANNSKLESEMQNLEAEFQNLKLSNSSLNESLPNVLDQNIKLKDQNLKLEVEIIKSI